MQKKKNLYKLDDICLFLSVIIFIVFLVQFRSLIPLFAGSDFTPLIEEARYLVLSEPIKMGLLLFSAVFFQIIGRVVRKKEKISLQVIEALSYRSRVSVAGLAAEIGRDQESLERIVRQLAAIPGAGVTYDGNYIRIQREDNKPESSKFDRDYNRVIKEKISMPDHPYDENGEKKSTAEDGYPEGFPEVLKKAGVKPEDIKDKNIQMSGIFAGKGNIAGSRSGSGDSKALRPNPLIIFILFIAFWPAAVIYVVSFYIKNMQKNALKNSIKTD